MVRCEDSRLNFKTHIHKLCAKASRSLGFLKRSTRSFRDVTTIITLYKSLVVPHFLYCSPIWSPFLKINQTKIQTIHHSFLRYLAYKSNFPLHRFDHNYNPIAFKFRLPSITSLHNYNDHLLAYKIAHNLLNDEYLSSIFVPRQISYTLRNPRQFVEFPSTLNYKYFSITRRLVSSWNKLSAEFRSAPLGSFKRYIKYLLYCYE